jgi:hypothetical protein
VTQRQKDAGGRKSRLSFPLRSSAPSAVKLFCPSEFAQSAKISMGCGTDEEKEKLLSAFIRVIRG